MEDATTFAAILQAYIYSTFKFYRKLYTMSNVNVFWFFSGWTHDYYLYIMTWFGVIFQKCPDWDKIKG